ncbi:MAG: undecaprenyl/decaprenyl-phosphate alpha-N-acetylglucosaminyl 1-phosphate transferase [Flavobacteriales bacterium]|nr:undecaprenyl/decaprenyl-phosphate alpha-N-acetylglucosaminyl 1-phosphate transferase [Flavobacteriales bacterium]
MLKLNAEQVLWVYAAFLVCATLFSFLINGLFLKFSRNLGVKDQTESMVRWSSTSKPAFGGISFYIMFLFSIACYSILFEAVTYINDIVQFLGVMAACSLGFVVGLADDAYNTKPFLKFFAQFSSAIILIATGTSINISGITPVDYFLTILWVVGLMNSINMLDNMDGITTTVSISVILAVLYMLFSKGEVLSIYFITLLGVLAGLLGFLYYNWNPSKMYMGDTGSQFLGVFLAAIGILYLWNGHAEPDFRIQTKQFIVALLVFIVPIIDTTTVTINRLLKGQSPFVGGKDHTTHHLSYLGLTDRQVALSFFGLSFLSVIFLIIIDRLIARWEYIHFGIFLAYFLILFGFLYGITRVNKSKEKR